MASADEDEIGATFMNGQEYIPIRATFEELGHPQPPTTIHVDNSTTDSFANDTIKKKLLKAIEMCSYWILDRTLQKQTIIYWKPGNTNLGN